LLYPDFTISNQEIRKKFYTAYLNDLKSFDREKLNQNDKISYDIFNFEVSLNLEGLNFHDNYTPSNQFSALPLFLGQLGSGAGSQPFKTVKDYEDWEKRATAFSVWIDSAIVYFRKGIAANYVLPHSLVVKMIPQMESLVTTDPTKSLFYGPINKLPADFSGKTRQD
jgi:uncharacterized protein (DUF885 family)